MTSVDTTIDYVATLKHGPLLSAKNTNAQETRAEERRQKFAKEIIDITLVEDNTSGDNDEGLGNFRIRSDCSWKVQRFRLTPDFLHQLIVRLPDKEGCTVAYLKHAEEGDIIALDEVRRLCRPSPSSYHMVLYEPNKTKDVQQETEHKYQGFMKFMINNVPQYSQNGCYQVKANDIRNWIIEGILDDEPNINQIKSQLNKDAQSINNIEKRISKITDEDAFDKHGQVLTGKKGDEWRHIKFNNLVEEKNNIRAKHDKSFELLKEMKEIKLKEIDIVLILELTDHKSQRNCWSATIEGSKKDYYENLIVQKRNWKTSLMFAGLEYDDETHMTITENKSQARSQYIVDTAGINVERVQHGFGFFHKATSELQKKWYNYDSYVDAYHGTYKEGIRTGDGIVYTPSGFYGGQFKNNLPCGKGVQVLKNGDVTRGIFNINTRGSKSNVSNIYARGLPHGKSTITFSDGAIYEGELKWGHITGQGIYVSATG